MARFPWCPPTRQALEEINQRLARIEHKLEQIMSEQQTEQQTIDAAVAQEQAEVTRLGNQDAAIAQVVTEILALQQQGVDVAALAAATANLATAAGADDTAVQQLQAAASPAPADGTTPDAPAAA